MEGNGRERKGQDWSGKERSTFKIGFFGENKKMKTKKYEVEITGTTPLLQNKPEDYGFDEQWVEKKASEDWEKEALKKLYRDNEGNIYQPSNHVERALMEAGKKIRVKGKGKATFSKLFGSMVSVEPFELVHENQDFEIHKQLVVIPSTKGRVMRYRPMLKDWVLKFFVVAEDEIPMDAIKESLEIAGRYSGLGDWRPEKKGKYGKFQVTSFHEVKN